MKNNDEDVRDVYMQFDFYHETDGNGIAFAHPEKIIETNRLNEVIDCLHRLEREHQNGKYIAGYMSFEASYAFFQLNTNIDTTFDYPLLTFGIFEKPMSDMALKTATHAYSVGKWVMHESKQSYIEHVDRIIEEIKKTTFTQLNYTTKWHAPFEGDPFTYYEILKKAQQSNYCAYLKVNNRHILSISPELFFQTNNHYITVRPMKGTIHRGKTIAEDEQLRSWLATSTKNQFENKLTTELMKKELHDITEKDTVELTKQFTVEKYPTVYQMTSEIRGKLKQDITLPKIFEQLFPCTSIAGTPKRISLQWIHELEPFHRDIYCGTVGYIEPSGNSVFNVAIRTLSYDKHEDTISYGAGGAITEKSIAIEEYNEVIAKTAILHHDSDEFALLETIRLHNGAYFLLDEHIDRIEKSASYFQYPFHKKTIMDKLNKVSKSYPNGAYRIRLLCEETGDFSVDVAILTDEFGSKQVTFADQPIDINNRFYYHKTTKRHMYETAKINNNDYFDVLLWNKLGEITEFTIGNIVIEKQGRLLTPPVASGLLAGTFRGYLLKNNTIEEAILTKQDIEDAERIWLINSVRKWVPVTLCK